MKTIKLVATALVLVAANVAVYGGEFVPNIGEQETFRPSTIQLKIRALESRICQLSQFIDRTRPKMYDVTSISRTGNADDAWRYANAWIAAANERTFLIKKRMEITESSNPREYDLQYLENLYKINQGLDGN